MKGKSAIKVLIAKPGLDGHDRGAHVIVRALRDEGMDVLYTGIRQTPERIAAVAADEDVDVVGLSCLSGAHCELFPRVLQELRARGRGDIPVLGGGTIPPEDVSELEQAGIRRVFGPGSSLEEIIAAVKELAEEKRKGDARKGESSSPARPDSD
ncbi:MAG: cobalamin B12-binding domain-containing protein [Candidatus Hydrogenedentota bacterium]|nr:MAG: cobalamin B12-binding domain-containing protein [Candidatus Hydrogenedentota bacterium]